MDLRIADAEMEIMKILWREERPVSSAEIRDELQKTKGWVKSTTFTLIRRLTEKKIITAKKDKIFYYTANITEDEYASKQMKGMIKKLFGGKAKNLVAALCQDNQLTEGDIEELREYFRMEDNT